MAAQRPSIMMLCVVGRWKVGVYMCDIMSLCLFRLLLPRVQECFQQVRQSSYVVLELRLTTFIFLALFGSHFGNLFFIPSSIPLPHLAIVKNMIVKFRITSVPKRFSKMLLSKRASLVADDEDGDGEIGVVC